MLPQSTSSQIAIPCQSMCHLRWSYVPLKMVSTALPFLASAVRTSAAWILTHIIRHHLASFLKSLPFSSKSGKQIGQLLFNNGNGINNNLQGFSHISMFFYVYIVYHVHNHPGSHQLALPYDLQLVSELSRPTLIQMSLPHSLNTTPLSCLDTRRSHCFQFQPTLHILT